MRWALWTPRDRDADCLDLDRIVNSVRPPLPEAPLTRNVVGSWFLRVAHPASSYTLTLRSDENSHHNVPPEAIAALQAAYPQGHAKHRSQERTAATVHVCARRA